MVFRGSNYEGPGQRPNMAEREDDSLFVPDVSKADNSIDSIVNGSPSILEKSRLPASDHVESMTEEEAEYNSLLDGLGPRFEDWWGTGILPVDADLLPQTIPGYKTPFRLLPTGMRSRLTNAELTNLRKVAKSLPCHFALGIVHICVLLFFFFFFFLIYIYMILNFMLKSFTREKQTSSGISSCYNQALGEKPSCENSCETGNPEYKQQVNGRGD